MPGPSAPAPGRGNAPAIERRLLRRVTWGLAVGVAGWVEFHALHILPVWAMDTSGLMAAAVIGAIVGATRAIVLLQVVVSVNAGLIVLIAGTALSERLARSWMRDDIIPPGGVDAVVAVSGGVKPDTTMSAGALDQLLFALEVQRRMPRAALVTTTVSGEYPRPVGKVSSALDQERVIGLLNAETRWIRIGLTRTTREEAVESARVLLPMGLRRIAVVASPMHTRRACGTFEAVGFTVTCLRSRTRGIPGWPSSTGPEDRLARFGTWVYERAASIHYRMNGWLKPIGR